MTAKEVIKKLREAGWTFQEGGNRTVGYSPDGTKKTVIHRHTKDIKPGTLRGIERQTGVTLR
jgi:predicted RNA binding protein YcfA (HicA-like mRNA interferase family)